MAKKMLNDHTPTPYHSQSLPTTTEELHKFILIGKESLKAQKAKIRAIEKANMALAAKEAALQDTQDIAEILLDAEVRLGEMLAQIKPEYSISSSKGTNGLPKGAAPRREKSLPPGINKKQSHEAQQLSRNPDMVEQVKQEARQNGSVATARDVYTKIKDKKIKYTETYDVTDAMMFAEMAIANLENILDDDPEREKAFKYIIQEIISNLAQLRFRMI
jgi:hypothetical protein